MSFVRWVRECADAPLDAVGGKARGLGQLLEDAVPVPNAFVLETAAYRSAMRKSGLLKDVAAVIAAGDPAKESAAMSAKISAIFERLTMPDGIRKEILDAYGTLAEGDESAPVAVRSSATAEDLAHASFAGQQETYLWVTGGDAVLRHVARCWGSLFTTQAIAYRPRFDISVEDLGMAVVVQAMVPAASAGVMMTLDPVTGDRSIIYIEACYGLGEGVVRGDVEVDRFWVEKATKRISKAELGHKTAAHLLDRGSAEVRLMPVESSLHDLPCLQDEEVLRIAELGDRVESEAGQPMDIEWAVAEGTRDLYALQARPETVWSSRPQEGAPSGSGDAEDIYSTDWSSVGEDWDVLHSTGAPDLHWSTDNIGEGLPGLLTPLGYSVWKENVDHAARISAWSIGALSKAETQRPADDRLLVRPFYGRAAMQTEFYALLGDRMPGTTGELSVQGVLGRVPEDLRFAPTRRRYPAIAVRLPWTLLTAPRAARRLAAKTHAWWQHTIERTPSMSLEDALHVLTAEVPRHGRENWAMQGVIVFGVVSPLFQAIAGLVAKTGAGDIAALSGAGGAEMAIISDVWRASRGEMTVEEVVARHGFHGPAEGEVSSTVWREDHEPLRRMIKEYASMPDVNDPVKRREAERVRLPHVQEEVVKAVARRQRFITRKVLRMAAAGIPMRGVAKRGMVQCIDVARATARRAGELLVESGVLAHKDDVFYLTLEELAKPLAPDIQSLVDRRRARRELYARIDVPAMWKGNPTPVLPGDYEAGDKDVVTGIGVSAGVVEGIVRVVEDPSFAEVGQDQILVAPTTDPSWSTVMFLSKALVVDIGGALSHAAVVARELGYPCVVNTRVGTKALRSGDRVRVDGGTGVVTVLERAPSSGEA